MKRTKKLLTLLLAVLMTLAMGSISVFAQNVPLSPADADNATITINNPAKGETYSIFKLFDATVSADGKISYQGTVPDSLSDFFVADANGYISPTDEIAVKEDGKIVGTKMTDELKAALETWAESATATNSDESNGEGELNFTGLPYGYYVMTTSHKSDAQGDQEAKAVISVTSTKPNATINDKNVNEPTASKEADKDSYSVGDTITYTATFDAPNYMVKEGGSDGESEQVVSYKISDTLPNFLKNVTVTSVVVKQPGVSTDTTITPTPAFDSNKQFVIPWVNETVPTANHEYTSKYKAGSQIIVTYTAVLTSKANVGAANENKVSIMPNVDRGNDGPEPYQETDEWNDTETITTHAAALQKTDGTKNLAGAKFKFQGLELEGAGGIYTVVSYDPDTEEFGTEVECDADGKLVIGGIDKNITLIGMETKAPDGYNKIPDTFELDTITMATTTTTSWGNKTIYYDADGNVVKEETQGGSSVSITEGQYSDISDIPAASIAEVVNEQGVELPGTGGIGTVIFYVLGSLLVIGCGIVLISKRRLNGNK